LADDPDPDDETVEAYERLVSAMAALGDTEELRALADAGDPWSGEQLVSLLAYEGDYDSLCAELDAGTHGAAELARGEFGLVDLDALESDARRAVLRFVGRGWTRGRPDATGRPLDGRP